MILERKGDSAHTGDASAGITKPTKPSAFSGRGKCGGMAENSFDLIVLGGGPGGYVAAIRASAVRHEDRALWSGSIWAVSASTGAASQPRRCCARPRSIT